MITVEQLQNFLKTKSTSTLRIIGDQYVTRKGLERWNRNTTLTKWYLNQYDCRRRLRTIIRFYDGEHEITIALRKKAGYYFLIELDRRRIFECEPEIIVLDQDKLDYVTEKYSELFNALVV